MAPSETVRLDALALADRKFNGGDTSSPVAMFSTWSLPSLESANTALPRPRPPAPRTPPRPGVAAGRAAPRARPAAKLIGGIRAGVAVAPEQIAADLPAFGFSPGDSRCFCQKILSTSASIAHMLSEAPATKA